MPARIRPTHFARRSVAVAIAVGAVAASGAVMSPRPPVGAQFDSPLVALTTEGAVRGAFDGMAIAWKNVPFAQAPTGALRWRSPQPPALRALELDATTIGKACPQTGGSALRPDAPPPAWNEDCLQLNIWRPDRGDGTTRRPVMVWFHGGGLVQGSAVDPLYDGKGLATNGNVVVVTANYRLGALGYLAHPAFIDQPNSAPGAGNYGLLDQIQALHWVQDNIAAFGGDPERVLIFGESAGGVSVCALLASPLAAGLFHGAIMQSGACRDALRRLDGAGPLPPATDQGGRFAAAAGCAAAPDVGACLRALPTAAVLAALPGEIGILNPGAETYDLVIDGHALPEPPMQALARGHGPASRVPFVLGANGAFVTVFALPFKATLTAAGYEATVRSLYRASAPAVLALYPVAMYDAPGLALADVTGDAGFVCPTRRVARARSAIGHPTWLYHYAFVTALARQRDLGRHHGAEIPFLFADFSSPLGDALTPEARQLAAAMQGYWARVAALDEPGTGAGAAAAAGEAADDPVAWTRYDPAADNGMLLGAKQAMTAGWRAAKCDLWDRIEGERGGATPGPGPRPTAAVPTVPVPGRGWVVLPVAFVP